MSKLAKVQRQAAIAITGAMKTTATDVLDPHAGLMPIDLAIEQVCQRAMLRMAALPETHALHHVVRQAAWAPAKTHKAGVDELYQTYKIDPGQVETIPIVRADTKWEPVVEARVAETTKEAMEDEEDTRATIRIYTDGSGYQGGVGAAAVMKRAGRADKVLHYHLGWIDDHTVYEGGSDWCWGRTCWRGWRTKKTWT